MSAIDLLMTTRIPLVRRYELGWRGISAAAPAITTSSRPFRPRLLSSGRARRRTAPSGGVGRGSAGKVVPQQEKRRGSRVCYRATSLGWVTAIDCARSPRGSGPEDRRDLPREQPGRFAAAAHTTGRRCPSRSASRGTRRTYRPGWARQRSGTHAYALVAAGRSRMMKRQCAGGCYTRAWSLSGHGMPGWAAATEQATDLRCQHVARLLAEECHLVRHET
jgi:hypothetical protein